MPPLVTDINLSLDDRFLYVSCWGTGELKQYDVSDPFNPRETGSVRIGGIVGQARAPAQPAPLNGGPQMVEVSRDGRRVYVTNSLYAAWDAQFYPEGIDGWMAKLDADPRRRPRARPRASSSSSSGERPHQVRLAGRRRLVRLVLLPGPLMHGGLMARGLAAGAARRLPRPQPGDGLAVRGRARPAGAAPRGRCCGALPPIALGHEAAIALAVALVLGLGVLADTSALSSAPGWSLVAFGIFRFVKPRAHFRWVGVRVDRVELGWWSFLMATAHGAGLMVAPVLLGAGAADEAAAQRPHARLGHRAGLLAPRERPRRARCTSARCSP